MPPDLHDKQYYALIEDGTLVRITETSKDEKHVFRCPNCGQEFTPKRGLHNVWHFAHGKGGNAECSYESYLHKVAKQKIRLWYEQSDKVELSLVNQSICSKYGSCRFQTTDCTKLTHTPSYNLKDYYDKCEIERGYTAADGTTYIADVMLSSSQYPKDPIFVEVSFMHPCSQEKKTAGVKIIEIPINNEDDIDNWLRHGGFYEAIRPDRFQYKSEEKQWELSHLHFYGFKEVEKREKIVIDNWPPKILTKYRLYPGNREECLFTDCKKFADERHGFFEICTPHSFEVLLKCRMIAIDYGYYKKRSCEMCRVSIKKANILCCKRHKRRPDFYLPCKPDEAENCRDFMFDQPTYNLHHAQSTKDFEAISDIWTP